MHLRLPDERALFHSKKLKLSPLLVVIGVGLALTNANAVLIDDFSQGAALLESVDGLPTLVELQTGLETNSVIGGTRRLTVRGLDRAVLQVDPLAGEFSFETVNSFGYYSLEYGTESPLNIDLRADGSEAFLLTFSDVSMPGLSRSGHFAVNGTRYDLRNDFAAINGAGTIRIPFSHFSTEPTFVANRISLQEVRVESMLRFTLDSITTVGADEQPVDHWQDVNTDPSVDWALSGVVHNDEVQIAYGNSTTLLVSTNGIDWTETIIRENDTFGSTSSIIYADGQFAGFYSGRDEEVWHWYFITSENGVAWDSNPVETNISYGEIAYGNGIYVIAGGIRGNTDILTSTDGIEWASLTENPISNIFGIKFGNGVFLIQGGDEIGVSNDGESWEIIDFGGTSTSFAISSLFFCNEEFILITKDGAWFVSSDGLGWEEVESDLVPQVREIHFIDGMYIASLSTESALAYSPNRIHWHKFDIPEYVPTTDFTIWNGQIIAVGSTGGIFLSDPIQPQLYFRGVRTGTQLRSYGPLNGEELEISRDLISWVAMDETPFEVGYSLLVDPDESPAFYRLGN